MSLRRILYVSSEAFRMKQSDLEELLQVARKRNLDFDINRTPYLS